MRPPRTGPTAAAAPRLEPIRPIPAPRSPAGSTFATETMASAGTAAPPIPCTTRPKTSTERLGARAQTTPPAANPTRPTENTALTP
jgi:hypothetical protein